jgi:outer membrane receptor protein involved in Fe transport
VSFRPDLTAFLGPEYIPVEMIERVEVAKGPLSALHGANAFLATVNVITRQLGSGQPVIAEGSGRAYAQGRGVGYGGVLVGGFDSETQSFIASVTAARLDRSGLELKRTFEEQDPSLARYRGYFDRASEKDLARPVGAFGQYRLQAGRYGSFLLQGGLQRLDSMGEFQVNSVLTHSSRISLENDWVSLRHEKDWGDGLSSAAWLGYSRGSPGNNERLYLTGNDAVSFTRGFRYQAIDGAFEINNQINQWVGVKGGLDVSYEPQTVLYYTEQDSTGGTTQLLASGVPSEVTTSNVGAFVQAGITPLQPNEEGHSPLQLTTNARVDLPNLFPAQFTWRAAIAYRWSDAWVTKLVAGRAFQTPSATLLYGVPGFGTSGNVIGNRTLPGARALVPQSIDSAELAVSGQLFGRLGVELAAYAQQVDGKIEFTHAGSHYQARNLGRQQSVGVEAGSKLVFGRLSMGATASLQRTVDAEENVISDQPPSLYPNLIVLGRANYAAPELHLNVFAQARYVGARGASQSNVALNNFESYTLPAYATCDLTVSSVGLAFLGAAQTTLSLGVKNLFDTRYYEPGFGGFDLPVMGRTALLELRQAY